MAEINVTNPVATSFYQWTTPDGNIITSPVGQSIYVDKPGTYIVTQYLQEGCSTYAMDTIQVYALNVCQVLEANKVLDFRGKIIGGQVRLDWNVQDNQQVQLFEVQKSSDGTNFTTVGTVEKLEFASYNFQMSKTANNENSYYRIKLINANNTKSFSALLRLSSPNNHKATIYPNPVKDKMYLHIVANKSTKMDLRIYDISGKQVLSCSRLIQEGINAISFDEIGKIGNGIFIVAIQVDGEINRQKIVIRN